jgi:hypothetical protein
MAGTKEGPISALPEQSVTRTNSSTSFDVLADYKPHVYAVPVVPTNKGPTFTDIPDTTGKPTKWTGTIRKRVLKQYRYDKLADDQLRLLLLQPGKPEDGIVCFMIVESLRKARKKYQALSYHWGSASPDNATNQIDIYPRPKSVSDVVGVKTRTDVKHLWIHDNLFSALRHLRLEDEPTLIWVDAICMNQTESEDGEEEVKQQVRRMGDIYNSAYSVCVWLGAGSPQTDRAMKFIEDMVILDKFDNMVQSQDYKEDWLALMELMKWQWFSRRWVVQEIALSRRASVHCGTKTVDWNDFSDAVTLFVMSVEQIKRLFNYPDSLPDVEGLGAVVLVDSVRHLARKSSDGDIQEYLVGLESLVSSLLSFDASKPHDVIYSLMAIARDTPQKFVSGRPASAESRKKDHRPFDMDIDYKRDSVQICVDFTEKCIQTSRSLDIICRHWAPNIKTTKLPSWISSIGRSAFGTPEQAVTGARRNGDSFVGAPSRDSRKNYNACRGSMVQPEFVKIWKDGDGNHLLKTKGFALATIEKCSDSIAGKLTRDWIRKGGWHQQAQTENIIPDMLWRTLVADRGPDGGNPPGWYRRACLQCLTTSGITDVNGHMSVDVAPLNVKERKPHSDVMLRFLRRVKNVVWNRKLFVACSWCQTCEKKGHDSLSCDQETTNGANGQSSGSTDHITSNNTTNSVPSGQDGTATVIGESMFGLAPSEAQENDLICLLVGCTVPVVLRPDGKYYEVIGEAFVYSKMDGEAGPDLDEDVSKPGIHEFTLK